MNTRIGNKKDLINKRQNRISEKRGEKNIRETEIKEKKNRCKVVTLLIELWEKVVGLLQKLADSSRLQVKGRIEFLVTEAIRSVLRDNYLDFRVNFEVKRNNNECDFVIWDSFNNKELDILNSFGGGLVDAISVALRLILSELYKSKVSGPIILDEVGKFISDDLQEFFGLFLKELSRRLGRQIIMISHKERILESADKIIRIVRVDNESAVMAA